MKKTEKPASPARFGRTVQSFLIFAVAALPVACSSQPTRIVQPIQIGQITSPAASRAGAGAPANMPAAGGITLAAYHDGDHPSRAARLFVGDKNQGDKDDKKQPDEPKDKGDNQAPKLKITLPMAIELCVNNNFRVQADAQEIGIAEGDLITSSLIPNSSLFADCQLIPLQHADIKDQLGPPQWDALVTVPIDWLVFGKRLAAMREARLGVEVKSADFANTLRTQLALTVDAYYEVLEDDAYMKLAEKNLDELKEIEKTTAELAQAKKVTDTEVDRAKLAVHEALLELHDRELALDIARAKLRPFLGRTAADPDYDVEGDLTVAATVPPPKLEEAVALAEAHRPDLLSGRKSIDQAHASLELERRRAKPQVSLQPGWTYQDQVHYTGFRNGSSFDIGISTTLPFTDRNQGNIRKAQAAIAERHFNYQGDRADALADVEASVANYTDAVEHLTLFNTKETLQAAFDLRKAVEAGYRAGNRKLIELLDAQRAYQSRLAHTIEFESFYWRSLNKLNASVGLQTYNADHRATEPLGKGAEKK
jgi:cobalt-zinc-cadmium efflux system outer membrane protein